MQDHEERKKLRNLARRCEEVMKNLAELLDGLVGPTSSGPFEAFNLTEQDEIAELLGKPKKPRASYSSGDVVSLNKAIKALPWQDSDARAWLRRHGLVRRVDGRNIVVWGDVLAEVRGGQGNEDGDWKPNRVSKGTPRAEIK